MSTPKLSPSLRREISRLLDVAGDAAGPDRLTDRIVRAVGRARSEEKRRCLMLVREVFSKYPGIDGIDIVEEELVAAVRSEKGAL